MTLSDYMESYKNIDKNKKDLKRLKIAVLRSFTCEQLEAPLGLECYRNNIYCDIKFGSYNQYAQEIIDEHSFLYDFNPDIIVVAVRLQELFPEFYLNYINLRKNSEELISEIVDRFVSLIYLLKKKCNSHLLINNFTVPIYTNMGIYDFVSVDGQATVIRKLNIALLEKIAQVKGAYIVDVDHLENILGKKEIENTKMWYLAKNPYKFDYYAELAKEYVRYIKAIYGINKKCIVLDLDNTLWGGIIGEDGFENIKLGDTYPGVCYKDFQQKLLDLSTRGVLLAINSKNNYEEAINVINNHPDMLLHEKDFVSLKINWNSKIMNIEEISNDLNIGLESIIFIDDNPVECELVKNSFNDVEVINLPQNPISYSRILDELEFFHSIEITDEDFNKTNIYKSQRKRSELKNLYGSIEEYFSNLDMKLVIREGDEFSVPRIAQLTQKTNQFNLTTKRYTEGDIRAFIYDGKHLIYYLRVIDKFGDNGITGVAIIEGSNPKVWDIDTFLLSCRIMGRNIEVAFLAYLCSEALKNGIRNIVGNYIPTTKNKVVENFYSDIGFEREEGAFILDLSKKIIKVPYYIKIE